MKKKILEIDFIKVLSAFGIISFHFACHIKSEKKFVFMSSGTTYGFLFVNIFWIVSGALHFYNNSEIKSLRHFYFKKFKALAPSFYILYTYIYFKNVFIKGKFFFRPVSPFNLIYSILLLDGYFKIFKIKTIYLSIGEWFLGALVIIYLLYPIILYGFKNLFIQTLLINIFFFSFLIHGNYFNIYDKNLIICITLFILGMIIIKYINLDNISLLIISLFIMLIYYFVNISIKKRFLIDVIYSPFFFCILFWIGKFIMKIKILNIIVSKLSLISYQLFLLQHLVIYKIIYIFPKSSSNVTYFCILFLCIITTIIFSFLLHWLAIKFIQTKIFIDFENWILDNSLNNNFKKKLEN
jgi:peptidoglycan/LPS O-acetylase OafA/YrhL